MRLVIEVIFFPIKFYRKIYFIERLLQNFVMGPYIYDVYTEGGWGSLVICHVFSDSIVFKQLIYCSFLWMVGVAGGQKIGHSLWMS